MNKSQGLLFGLAALFVVGLILSRRAAASASSPAATGKCGAGSSCWVDYQ